jgi:hypothetical protein
VLFDLGVVVGLLRARMMIDAFKVFVFIVVIMFCEEQVCEERFIVRLIGFAG